MVLKNVSKKIICGLVVLFSVAGLFAAKIPDYKGRVNDYANVISKSDEAEIEQYFQDNGLEWSDGQLLDENGNPITVDMEQDAPQPPSKFFYFFLFLFIISYLLL